MKEYFEEQHNIMVLLPAAFGICLVNYNLIYQEIYVLSTDKTNV